MKYFNIFYIIIDIINHGKQHKIIQHLKLLDNNIQHLNIKEMIDHQENKQNSLEIE